MPPSEPSSALRRLSSVLGVMPLGVYVVLHLWETSAASSGRRQFADTLMGTHGAAGTIALEILLILVPLLLHAVIGVLLWVRRSSTDEGRQQVGMRPVQRITGLLAFAFILLHMSHTWVAKVGGADGGALYDSLRADLGTPLLLIGTVVGMSAVLAHLGLGLPAFAQTMGIVRTEAGIRSVRLLGGVVAISLWLVSLNTVSHFVVGRAILWGGAPSQMEAPP